MANRAGIVKPANGVDTLQQIQHSIVVLRGKQVLLDFQLAAMYGVETKVLNQAVKRNIERFPDDFMFRLTPSEMAAMRSQFVTAYTQSTDNERIANGAKRNYSAHPYAFTEQGVAMLSSVLRSETAVQVNIAIMRAFVMARQIMTETRENALAIEELRVRMKMLEEALENNLGAVNDLTEETQKELENIYNAIAALSVKKAPVKPRNPVVGLG